MTRRDPAFTRSAGTVAHDEARGILLRFNASHWRNHGKEVARYSIPANPDRDDDIRLGAYIARAERLEAAARVVVASRMCAADCQCAHADAINALATALEE